MEQIVNSSDPSVKYWQIIIGELGDKRFKEEWNRELADRLRRMGVIKMLETREIDGWKMQVYPPKLRREAFHSGREDWDAEARFELVKISRGIEQLVGLRFNGDRIQISSGGESLVIVVDDGKTREELLVQVRDGLSVALENPELWGKDGSKIVVEERGSERFRILLRSFARKFQQTIV